MRTKLLAVVAMVCAIPSLHAQEAAVQDSIVQITADAQGLTLVSPNQLPRTGTFWLVSPESGGAAVPLPCPPLDISLPIYSLVDGVFLVDGTVGSQASVNMSQARQMAALEAQANTVVNLIARIQTTTANQQMRAMGMDSFTPPGFDDGVSGTNDYEYAFAAPVYTTNDLWLEMNGKTNTAAYLTIHRPWTVINSVYDLLYTTNLSSPRTWQWVLRTNPKQMNLAVSNAVDAQGFYWLNSPNDLAANDSLGTNFWVAFYSMDVEDIVKMSLYISSPVGATGTVTIPGFGITNTFSVAAGAVTNMSITNSAMLADYYKVETNGIHITASQPVSVYGMFYEPAASTAFTGYPTKMLGTNYCIMAYPGINSQIAIVATEDNTSVTISPSSPLNYGGDTYTDFYITNLPTLQQGQTYQINIDPVREGYPTDVSGAGVTSDKPIAVFAGANLAYVPEGVFIYAEAANPLVQQQLPVEDWGTNVLALSFAGRTNGDDFRILTAYSNTVVSITGRIITDVDESYRPFRVTTSDETVVVTNDAGQSYDILVEGPVEFQASQPIQVAHFSNGEEYDHGTAPFEGDPCEILLPSTGHYLKTNIVFIPFYNTSSTGDFDENFLSLIVPQSAITNTVVDGSVVAATNFVAIGSSGFYGAQLAVTNGTHKVTSSQPVGVEVYGFGSFDAYGYFGGMVK